MSGQYISILFYSVNDTFSKHILGMLDNAKISDNEITRIPVNSMVVKNRLYKYLGDVNIPILVAKDADGNVETKSGKDLQDFIRKMVDGRTRYAMQQRKPQEGGDDILNDINGLPSAPISSSSIDVGSNTKHTEQMPVKRDDEDAISYNARLQEFYNSRKQKQNRNDGDRRVNVSAVLAANKDASVEQR